ncbi:lipopolysaccharide biosynthesis protein [Aliiglaciecola sp. CAU 1673]|uniref:lipopolysaccharide biosynthesis protein n=1 Tax=Aliiglaciecola sp. CAU 1673 TaxID=3032595 RepID=UPI0023DA32A9|nr:lipopolysaccharide biosynthesis protein [Aliiglaciecola sp. CAU 1673]MDF2177506.1 lipopolysaccharide biosynthesis protein [Aliiglaciecola sp. CAU 1673]
MLSSHRFMKLGSIRKPLLQVMSGAVLAQLITLAVVPLLTRLYSPEQFGQFGVFMSVSGILSAVFCLRFELAVYACRTERQARATVVLGGLFAFINLVFFSCVAMFSGVYAGLLPEGIEPALLFVPLASAAIAVFLLLSNYLGWRQQFKVVAVAKVVRSAAIAIAQTVMVILPSIGLVLGDVVGRVLSLFMLCSKSGQSVRNRRPLRRRFYLSLIRRHRRFIRISTPAALLNVSVTQAPTVFLAALFSIEAAGFYALAQKVMAAPMVLIGQAVSQVYNAQFSRLWKSHRSACHSMLQRAMLRLFLIGLGPMLLLAMIAPWLFSWLLGAQWEKVGEFVRILAPMFLAQFVVSPFINLTAIANKQGTLFLWDSLRLILVVACFVLSAQTAASAEVALVGFSLGMSVCYLLMYVLLNRIASSKETVIGGVE